MSAVCTTCPYCGVGCGVQASLPPRGLDQVQVQGDPDHPANAGRLCTKGTNLADTLGLEGRLLAPRIDGHDSDWDSALGRVATEFRHAIDSHGPDSVAFYVSGQLLTEDYYVANKLMKGFIGSANIDTNSRLCMASSVAGHRRAFGTDTVPGQYEDIELADLVVLVGSNMAWCHPVLYQRLAAAKQARPDLQVVVIDPRRTVTAQGADLHLAIRGDGDTALFNLLLAELAARGLVDTGYVDAHVSGLDRALAAARATDPGLTGLPEAQIARFLDLWCRSEKVVTLYSQGVNQSGHGTDKVNAILNCHLATGRIGRPGMGPLSLTGQPNAMGGREVGGLANMLAAHLDLENPDHRAAVRGFWTAPALPERPGLKAVDLFRACADGRIKALWIMSTNPAVSMPEADAVAAAIRAVPFTVVSDILAETDTNALAQVLLPAAAWGEKSGTVTNSERRISRQRAFLPMPGQVRPDWQIIAEVGRRMGWEQAFAYDSPAQIFREHAALSGVAAGLGRDFDISALAGLSDVAYDGLAPVVWPLGPDGLSRPRFFGQGGFYHPDGKARMLPVIAPEPVARAPGVLELNTGRVRDQWHTMTRTGRAPRLGTHLAEPYLELHPEDARALGLRPAHLARVEGPTGVALLRVLVSDRARRGAAFAPMHWTDQTARGGRVNAAVPGAVDPVSGQPALKAAQVRVRPWQPAWYGYAASVTPLRPRHDYAALARVPGGWQLELASATAVADWQAEARATLALDPGQGRLSLMQDPARGVVRVAVHDGPTLIGLFFAAPEPVALSRAAIPPILGQPVPPLAALAGVPGADRPDPGAIVCACLGVGVNQIRQAIAEGARDLGALAECLGAGSNCGSCRPELQALIEAQGVPALAAE